MLYYIVLYYTILYYTRLYCSTMVLRLGFPVVQLSLTKGWIATGSWQCFVAWQKK